MVSKIEKFFHLRIKGQYICEGVKKLIIRIAGAYFHSIDVIIFYRRQCSTSLERFSK